MKKFSKVYRGPGYPIDPVKQAARIKDAWVNTIIVPDEMPCPDWRYEQAWSRIRHLFAAHTN